MIRRTLGAPCGGTTRAGQYGFDWSACRPICPPNFGGGGGRYLPSIVVVAPGDPGVPVVCWASAEPQPNTTATATAETLVVHWLFFISTSSNDAAKSQWHVDVSTASAWRAA